MRGAHVCAWLVTGCEKKATGEGLQGSVGGYRRSVEVYKGPSMARPPCRAALRLWPDRVQQYWHWHPFRGSLA